MAALTKEQMKDKKALLLKKMEEVKALFDELQEAGGMELSDEELDGVSGGQDVMDYLKATFGGKSKEEIMAMFHPKKKVDSPMQMLEFLARTGIDPAELLAALQRK